MVMQKSLSEAMNAKILGGSGNNNNKETLVLAHGYGGDQSVWDKVVPYLTQYYQVLVFDWSFSGAINNNNKDVFDELKYSSYDDFANDLIGLMDEMKLSCTIFVGHSMSGIIGCIASVKRPHLFKRLVLVSSSPRFKNIEDYEGGFEESEIEQLFSSIEFNFEEWSSCFPTMVVDPNDPQTIEKFTKCLKKMKPEIALHVGKIVFLSDERSILEKITTPCTIIITKKDCVVPNSVPYYMQSKIKEGLSTVEIINTQGHFPQLTACMEFIHVLLKAIQ